MIKLPEILKAKEVKEFIDWVQQDRYTMIYDQDENGDISKDAELDEQLLYEMIDFYQQPFIPEMITEYFSNRNLAWDRSVGLKMFQENKWVTISLCLYATTLSQFITNCIQANIKLNWKES